MIDGLIFDARSHTYIMRGELVPGVTSVLKPLIDFAGIPRDVLEAKADLGRRIHAATEFDDDGDLDEDSVEEDVAPYLAAYRLFRQESGAVVVANERMVYDPMYRYAGTLDRVLAIDGVEWLTDLKSCVTTPLSAGPQTAAYLRALNDPRVTRRAALRLRPDGTYRFEPLTSPDDWSTFYACLAIRRYLEKHQ